MVNTPGEPGSTSSRASGRGRDGHGAPAAGIANPASRRALDPRVALLLTLAAAVALWAPGGWSWVPAAATVALALAGLDRSVVRLATVAVMVLLAWFVGSVLPVVAPGPATVVAVVAVQYTVRFGLVAMIMAHLVSTTPPAQLTAALRAARIPRAVVVPLAVMLRFLPVIAGEAVAVAEAMRLRGLATWRDVLRHPVRTIERFVVPVVSSSLRVGEDLSSAALLRGFGSPIRPTALVPPRLGVADLVVGVVAALAVIGTLVWP